jgi:Domain of unknown function (DUF4234)
VQGSPGGYGGYGPPPDGGWGPPPGRALGPPLQPLAFTERSQVLVLVLTFVTCGLYALVWKFQTTDELRIASGDESLKPGLDLLLTFVTCGIWALYCFYRNAQVVYRLSLHLGLTRSDPSTPVILCAAFGLPFVSMMILQGEYNAIAQAARARRLPS